MTEWMFKRGEIYWANIEEEETEKNKIIKSKRKGHELQKNRPAVIISNDKQNKFSGVVIVALITSRVDKVYFFEVAIELENKPNKIMTDQLFTLDKSRLERKMGMLNKEQLKQLARGLHTVLELNDCE